MNRNKVLLISVIIFIIITLLVIRFANSPSQTLKQAQQPPPPPPGMGVNVKSKGKDRADMTPIELYVNSKKVALFNLTNLKKIQITKLPANLKNNPELRNHTVVKIADLLRNQRIDTGDTVKFLSYDNHTVEFNFSDIYNDDKQLIVISTHAPAWKLSDLADKNTFGRGRGSSGGYIMRGVKRVTVLSHAVDATQKQTGKGCDNKVYTSVQDALRNSKTACNLSLANKNLDALPQEVIELKNLKILNLGHNSFTQMPEEILSLTSLEELNLSSNLLKDLPSLDDLTSLRILKLGRNDFTEVPQGALNLSHLEIFELDNNKIRIVPPEISQLTALKDFEFAYNQISELPPQVAQLKNVDEVDLKENPISEKEKAMIKSYFPYAKIEF